MDRIFCSLDKTPPVRDVVHEASTHRLAAEAHHTLIQHATERWRHNVPPDGKHSHYNEVENTNSELKTPEKRHSPTDSPQRPMKQMSHFSKSPGICEAKNITDALQLPKLDLVDNVVPLTPLHPAHSRSPDTTPGASPLKHDSRISIHPILTISDGSSEKQHSQLHFRIDARLNALNESKRAPLSLHANISAESHLLHVPHKQGFAAESTQPVLPLKRLDNANRILEACTARIEHATLGTASAASDLYAMLLSAQTNCDNMALFSQKLAAYRAESERLEGYLLGKTRCFQSAGKLPEFQSLLNQTRRLRDFAPAAIFAPLEEPAPAQIKRISA